MPYLIFGQVLTSLMEIAAAVVLSVFGAQEASNCLEYVRFARLHQRCFVSAFTIIFIAAVAHTINFLSPAIILVSIHSGVHRPYFIDDIGLIIIVFVVYWLLSVVLLFIATTDHVFIKNRYQLIQMLCTNLQHESWRVLRSPWRVLLVALTKKCGGIVLLAVFQSALQCGVYLVFMMPHIRSYSIYLVVLSFMMTSGWNILVFITLFRLVVFYPIHELLRLVSIIALASTSFISYSLFYTISGSSSREASSIREVTTVWIVTGASLTLLCFLNSILTIDSRQRINLLLRNVSTNADEEKSVIEEVSRSLRQRRAERRQVQVHPLVSTFPSNTKYLTSTLTTPSAALISVHSQSDISIEEADINQL